MKCNLFDKSPGREKAVDVKLAVDVCLPAGVFVPSLYN
jgi:hypothetical protein